MADKSDRLRSASPDSNSEKEEANPKRLVIFCDGTWNDLRMSNVTNVVRLAKCVLPTGLMEVEEKGKVQKVRVAQVVFYDEGVGVSEEVSRLADKIVEIEGGALGKGLDAKIEKAYRFLVLNYDKGDEIFIFGFSRGAYTARSLCGLIRNCGVLRRSNFNLVPEALKLYRSGEKPSSLPSQQFRQSNSHPIIAGPEDYTDVDREIISNYKADHGLSQELNVVPPEIRRRGYHTKYLGVWDTVGSLGVPTRFETLYRLTKGKYQFHDEVASSLIENLRHAVAIDEDRRTFDTTPVSNIHELNQLWAAAKLQLQVDLPDQTGYIAYEDRPYQQKWFPGDHGAVGGGNAERGLSSSALIWIAKEASAAGLELDDIGATELCEAARLAQPCANWRINRDGTPRPQNTKDLLGEIGGYQRRLGPATFDEIHESARERWRRDPSYRPFGMLKFKGLPQLDAAAPSIPGRGATGRKVPRWRDLWVPSGPVPATLAIAITAMFWWAWITRTPGRRF